MSLLYVISKFSGGSTSGGGGGGGGGPLTDPATWIGKDAVIRGDSITRGVAASDDAHRWATLMCIGKGGTANNIIGVDGMTAQHLCGPRYNVANTPTKTSGHSYLIIALGTNDAGYSNGIDQIALFKTSLEAIVDDAVSKGWLVTEIILLSPYYVLSFATWVGTCSVTIPATQAVFINYANAVEDTAILKGTHYYNIRQAMKNAGFDTSFYAADLIHPNNLGHQGIANIGISAF